MRRRLDIAFKPLQQVGLCCFLALGVAACTAEIGGYQDETGPTLQADPDEGEGEEFSTFTNYNLPLNSWVKVCKVNYGVNNRSGAGTGYMVLRVLTKGTMARTLARSGNWYRLQIQSKVGWSYGRYLCPAGSPQPPPPPQPGQGGSSGCHSGSKFSWSYCSSSCPCGVGEGDCDRDSECKPGLKCKHDVGSSYGTTNTVDVCLKPSSSPPKPSKPAPPSGSSKINLSRDGIINASKAFVGFSYWWGGARFKVGGKDYGKCHSPTYGGHSGSYGGDCSGFAGKVWQLPNAMPFDANKHPYSTYHFKNQRNYWSSLSRSSARRADALVYNSGGSGHIVIYEKGDAWGQAWTYEARGCSYGVVHNLRSISSKYVARKRNGI